MEQTQKSAHGKCVLVCVGTRPEWLKVKPLLPYINHKLLFTGQHRNLLKDVSFDYDLGDVRGISDRLASVIAGCSEGFPETGYDMVLVQGDTASAFGCALAAFHRKKHIIYLESGLRSYDLENPFPEEGYRQMISRISNTNLCPTELNRENLEREGVTNGIVVGNTVLDNLVGVQTSYQPQVLVTMHRRENLRSLSSWFYAINGLAAEHPELRFVLPMHPNPEIRGNKYILNRIEIVDPMPHNELVGYMKDCIAIITDSGGLQEEGAFLDKKVLVCRKTTERPEGIGTGHTIMCENPEALREEFPKALLNHRISEPCPYGDGHSAERIAKIINEL
jgi:UDP-N-acetylglucosamine 2-epimerase (non-hydrolysing)